MNLLPMPELKRVALDNVSRAIIVGGVAFFLAAIVSLIVLAPAVFLAHGNEALATSEVPARLLERAEEDRKEVQTAQAAIKNVSSVVSSSTPAALVVKEALTLRPLGVRVVAITFVDVPTRSLSISG